MPTKTISTYVAAGYTLALKYSVLDITTTGGVGGKGVYTQDYSQLVSNAGKINNTVGGNGVYLLHGGGVVNQRTGFIGGAGGVVSYPGYVGYLTNYGTIESTTGRAVRSCNVTNGSYSDLTALIAGGGVVMHTALANFATIVAGVSASIGGKLANGGAADTTALMAGRAGAQGYQSRFGQDGGPGGAGSYGVAMYGGVPHNPGVILNSATIAGGYGGAGGYGYYNGGAGGAGGVGVSGDSLVSVTNHGVIDGGHGGYGGHGAYTDSLGSGVGGAGGAGGAGVALYAGAALINNGVIAAGQGGVGGFGYFGGGNGGNGGSGALQSSGAGIVNYGTITGGAGASGGGAGGGNLAGAAGVSGDGIMISGAGAVTNGAASDTSALIEGAAGLYAGGAGAATVTNFGTIKGDGGTALSFASSNDLLIVEAGSVFTGKVLGGGGTLDLAAGVGILAGLSAGGNVTVSGSMPKTTFTNFGTVEIAAGSRFKLSGGGTIATGHALIDAGSLASAPR